MDSLPLIAAAVLGFLFLNNSKNSSSSSAKKEDEKPLNLYGKSVEFNCLETQFKDKNGKCQFFWIDGETDDRVKQEFDSIVKNNYKGKSLNDLCDDKKVKFDILPNPNANDIIKLTITNLWKPAITGKMLPPTSKSPDFVKVIWKKVTDLYFSKVCGL